MVADLQPPLDCKKIALLGPCPTYDCVLMDSSIIFLAVMQVPNGYFSKCRTVFLQKFLVRWAIDPLNSSLTGSPYQEFVALGGPELAGLFLSKILPQMRGEFG